MFLQIFRKEPFFYGHDNYDQLVKIAKVSEDREVDLVEFVPYCWVTCVWVIPITHCCFCSESNVVFYLFLMGDFVMLQVCIVLISCRLLLPFFWLFYFNDFSVY